MRRTGAIALTFALGALSSAALAQDATVMRVGQKGFGDVSPAEPVTIRVAGLPGTRMKIVCKAAFRESVEPTLSLTSPGGATVPLGASTHRQRAGRKLVVKWLELDEIGVYLLTVGAANGTQGEIDLLLRGRYPRRFDGVAVVTEAEPIAAIRFDALSGDRVKLKLRIPRRTGFAPQVGMEEASDELFEFEGRSWSQWSVMESGGTHEFLVSGQNGGTGSFPATIQVRPLRVDRDWLSLGRFSVPLEGVATTLAVAAPGGGAAVYVPEPLPDPTPEPEPDEAPPTIVMDGRYLLPGQVIHSDVGESVPLKLYSRKPVEEFAIGIDGQEGHVSVDVSGTGDQVGSLYEYDLSLAIRQPLPGPSAPAKDGASGGVGVRSRFLGNDVVWSGSGVGLFCALGVLFSCDAPQPPVPFETDEYECYQDLPGDPFYFQIRSTSTFVGEWRIEYESDVTGETFTGFIRVANPNGAFAEVVLPDALPGIFNGAITAFGRFTLQRFDALGRTTLNGEVEAKTNCESDASLGDIGIIVGAWSFDPDASLPDSLVPPDHGTFRAVHER